MSIYVASGSSPSAFGATVLGWVDAKVAGAKGDGSTDDTTALQNAINSVPTGGTLYLPAGTYNISSTLTVNSAIRIQGAGVSPLYGTIGTSQNAMNVPFVSPHLSGAVLNMTAAATDALDLTGAGLPVHLKDFGITFASAIRFSNTGHGVTCNPPAYSSEQDNGPMGSRWSSVMVYGHDGNHFAFNIVNPICSLFDDLQSWGGGGIKLLNNSVYASYGNCTFIAPYHQVIAGGSAHGIETYSEGSSPINLMAFIRPQVTVEDLGATDRTTLGIATAPTSAQATLASGGSHTAQYVTFIAPDFETNVSSPCMLSDFVNWNADKAGLLNTVSGSGGAGWQ